MAHTRPREERRIPALDGMRGVAILLVMLIHFPDPVATDGGLASRIYLQIAGTGWIGVDVFFVLSGFLITGLLLHAKESPNYFRDFYARRTLRIFPLYYACLGIWFVAIPLLSSPSSSYFQESVAQLRQEQAWYWAYLSNWKMGLDGAWAPLGASVYWSLAIEEQFYLVWATVVLLCTPRRLCQVCAALMVTALAIRIGLVAIGSDPILIYVSTPTRMDALAAGALVSALFVAGDHVVAVQRLARWVLPAALGCLGATWVWIGRFSEYHPLMQTAGFTALSMLFASLLVMVISASDTSWLVAALSGRVLRFFGKHSYAMYLSHLTIAQIIVSSDRLRPLVGNHDLLLQAAKLTISIATTVAAGFLSWHVLEKHFLALKRYFSSADAVPLLKPI